MISRAITFIKTLLIPFARINGSRFLCAHLTWGGMNSRGRFFLLGRGIMSGSVLLRERLAAKERFATKERFAARKRFFKSKN